MTGTPEVTVNELPADQWQPVSRVLRIDRTLVLDQRQAFAANGPATPTAPEGPPLAVVPSWVDGTWATDTGVEYFVPAAEIARRAPTSAVPAVFLDRVSGGWSLRVVLNLRRHPNLVADQGSPLELGNLSLRLYCPLENGEDSLPIADVSEQPPAEPDVVHRLVARVPITTTWIDRLRTVPGIVLLVTGVARYSPSAALQRELADRVAQGDSTAADPVTLMLSVDPEGVPMYFPPGDPANAPIYAQVDGTGGGGWITGPAGVWQSAPVGDQFYALPTEYRLAFDTEHAQPAVTVLLLEPVTVAPAPGATPTASYRVRIRFKLVPWFDPELVERLRRDITESTGVVYPELVVGGFQSAAFVTSTLFNDLGGTVLGPEAVTATVDGRGFELVFDCSMEFYTLLCGLLAPPSGPPTGLEGRIRFTLAPASDGGAAAVRDVPVRIRLDMPTEDFLVFEQVPLPDPATWPPGWVPPLYARVRNLAAGDAQVGAALAVLLVDGGADQPPAAALQARADPERFVVPAAGTPAPPAPEPIPPPPAFPGTIGIDPDTERPEVRAFQEVLVANGHLQPEDVDGRYSEFVAAMTKRLQRDVGLPDTGDVDAATWQAAFPQPAPPPPYPGPAEVVLALVAEGVDPVTIGALALSFSRVSLAVAASAVLERVHQLAAATIANTTVRVRSFQLAHPEGLPAAIADLYGMEVQIRRGERAPVTAYLTTEEPDKTVTLALLIGDLVAGVDPRQPTFDWRRRNMTPGGTGEWSPWESVTGPELFATPVLA